MLVMNPMYVLVMALSVYFLHRLSESRDHIVDLCFLQRCAPVVVGCQICDAIRPYVDVLTTSYYRTISRTEQMPQFTH